MSGKLCIMTLVLPAEFVYIEEWVEFHLKQGFDHVYLYLIYKNTEQYDIDLFNMQIDRYKDNNKVKLSCLKWPPHGFQDHIATFLKNEASHHQDDWLCPLDIDEFIYSPIKDKSVKDIVHEYEENNIAAVHVNWKCFGSNGLISRPESVLKSFIKCGEPNHPNNYSTKSIVKINTITGIDNSHRFHVKRPYHTTCGMVPTYAKANFRIYLENEPRLIINHYIVRSKDEYQMKIQHNPHRADRYNWEFFDTINKMHNTIENTDILKKL